MEVRGQLEEVDLSVAHTAAIDIVQTRNKIKFPSAYLQGPYSLMTDVDNQEINK